MKFSVVNNLKNYLLATVLGVALYLGAMQVSYGQNLILNGQFTSVSNMPDSNGGGITTPNYSGVNVTSWNNTGYAFLFAGGNVGTATITGSGGDVSFWQGGVRPPGGGPRGPFLSAPPGGGNVIALDGAYQVGPITQTVNLAAGTYMLTFQWAGTQQSGYDGQTTDSWSVALGKATGVFTQGSGGTSGTLAGGQTTMTVTNYSHGFTGWMTQTFTLTTDGTANTLYFLANGTPTGVPPFSLLANVSLVAVPEPVSSAAFALLFVLMIVVGNRIWRRFQAKAPTVA